MADKKFIENLILNDIPGNCIYWKNFSGRPSEFNRDGKRSFHLALDEDFARDLETQGWKIKWPKEQNEEGTLRPLLPVFLRFDVVPPNVWMINESGKLKLDDESVEELDHSYIEKVDLVITPYHWEFNGQTGIKAYVKSMAAVMEEDPISAKYRDLPDRTRRHVDEDDEVPWN